MNYIFPPHLKFEALRREKIRHVLIIAYCAPDFYKNKIIFAAVRFFRGFPDSSLDLIGDFRYHLDGAPEKFSSSLPVYQLLVNLPCRHVIAFWYIIAEESFIVAEVLVYFPAVVRHPPLSVLRRPERAGVDVYVGVYLHCCRRESGLLQYLRDGRRGYALPDARNRSAHYDYYFHEEAP